MKNTTLITSKVSIQDQSSRHWKWNVMFLGGLLTGVLSLMSTHAQTRDVHAEYTKNWETVGPPKGTLMIIGGAAASSNHVYFMDLVGNPNAPIVYIPTAGSKIDETNMGYVKLVEAGAKNLTILHTRDREEANSEAFVSPLRKAKAVYIGGGFQSRLADAYLNTLTHQLLFEILERGGVVAGSSAGASIQGSYLYGGGAKQRVGFGFVKKSAIGQHYIRRNRMGSVARILKNHSDLFGFGVDEATAAVVRGNELEVQGDGKVAIYDPTRPGYPGDQPQEYLFAGDKYDMASRKIMYRSGPSPQDLWTGGGKKQWQDPSNNWGTAGPPQGKLLIYGSKKTDVPSLEHFLTSLASPEDPVVVLSTGSEEMRVENQQIASELQKLGAKKVSFLHTIDSDKANSKVFANVLSTAKAIWISDSRSWQLIDAYLYTLIHKELFGVLQRNGIIGGNGDGAAVMASRLFGEPENYKWHTGYGLVKNTIILKTPQNRKSLTAVKEIQDKNPKLLTIALTPDSRLVIEANQVTGKARIYKSNQENPVTLESGKSYFLEQD